MCRVHCDSYLKQEARATKKAESPARRGRRRPAASASRAREAPPPPALKARVAVASPLIRRRGQLRQRAPASQRRARLAPAPRGGGRRGASLSPREPRGGAGGARRELAAPPPPAKQLHRVGGASRSAAPLLGAWLPAAEKGGQGGGSPGGAWLERARRGREREALGGSRCAQRAAPLAPLLRRLSAKGGSEAGKRPSLRASPCRAGLLGARSPLLGFARAGCPQRGKSSSAAAAGKAFLGREQERRSAAAARQGGRGERGAGRRARAARGASALRPRGREVTCASCTWGLRLAGQRGPQPLTCRAERAGEGAEASRALPRARGRKRGERRQKPLGSRLGSGSSWLGGAGGAPAQPRLSSPKQGCWSRRPASSLASAFCAAAEPAPRRCRGSGGAARSAAAAPALALTRAFSSAARRRQAAQGGSARSAPSSRAAPSSKSGGKQGWQAGRPPPRAREAAQLPPLPASLRLVAKEAGARALRQASPARGAPEQGAASSEARRAPAGGGRGGLEGRPSGLAAPALAQGARRAELPGRASQRGALGRGGPPSAARGRAPRLSRGAGRG